MYIFPMLPSSRYVCTYVFPMLPSSWCRYPQNVENLTATDVKGISRLVEHPVPVYPPGEATEAKELPIYLTANVSLWVQLSVT